MSVSLALIAVKILYSMVFSMVLIGFFAGGGFTMAYSRAREEQSIQPEYPTLAVSFISGMSIYDIFWAQSYFRILPRK